MVPLRVFALALLLVTLGCSTNVTSDEIHVHVADAGDVVLVPDQGDDWTPVEETYVPTPRLTHPRT